MLQQKDNGISHESGENLEVIWWCKKSATFNVFGDTCTVTAKYLLREKGQLAESNNFARKYEQQIKCYIINITFEILLPSYSLAGTDSSILSVMKMFVSCKQCHCKNHFLLIFFLHLCFPAFMSHLPWTPSLPSFSCSHTCSRLSWAL